MQKHCIIILWGSLRRKELKPMNKTLAGYTQNPERKKKSDLDKYITTPSTSFPGGIPGNEVGVLLLRTQKL